MKIWVDIINSPQVTFFVPFINKLKAEGNEIFVTCRNSGNTVHLLRQQNLDFTVVGDKAMKSTLAKLLSFPIRIYKLARFVKQENPDIAI